MIKTTRPEGERLLTAMTELLESITDMARPDNTARLAHLLETLAKLSGGQFKPRESSDAAPPTGTTGWRAFPVLTGFHDLDAITGGFEPGQLTLLTGTPGSGKTSLGLNIALHAAVDQRVPVGIFSLETSKESVTERLLSAQAQVDTGKLHRGLLSESEFDRISNALGPLGEAPIYIDDSPSGRDSEAPGSNPGPPTSFVVKKTTPAEAQKTAGRPCRITSSPR